MPPTREETLRKLDLLKYADPSFIAALTHFVSQRGMTWKEFGSAAGVAKATVDKWRNNASTPNSSTVLSICDAFGVARSEFFAIGERIVAEHRARMKKSLEEKLDELEELADEDFAAAGLDPESRRRFVDAARQLLVKMQSE